MQGPSPIQLQSDSNIDLTQLQSVAKIDNGFFHVFGIEKLRQLVDICSCQILRHIEVQGTSVPNYYLRIGTFVQRMDQSIFVRMNFQNLVTFVFENPKNQGQLFLLSFQVQNPAVQSFDESINEASQIVEYKSENYEKAGIKLKMDTIIEGELTQDMIQNIEYIGNILKTVGGVLGTVAKNVFDPAAKAETIMQNGFQILSQKMVSQQNKQRWNSIKTTASNLNEKMTEMYKPIDNAFKMIVSSIGENFNKSENKYIKNIKKFSKATAATLNNSYKRAQHQLISNQVGKQNQETLSSEIPVHEQSSNELNN